MVNAFDGVSCFLETGFQGIVTRRSYQGASTNQWTNRIDDSSTIYYHPNVATRIEVTLEAIVFKVCDCRMIFVYHSSI